MRYQDKDKLDVQYRRLNIYRNKKNRLIYYFKQSKRAYKIDQSDIRFIQLYNYRLQFSLLIMLLSFVASQLAWVGILTGLLVLAGFEFWFRYVYLKKLQISQGFQPHDKSGIIQSTMAEPKKVIHIKMFAFGSIAIFSTISAYLGEYSPAYFYGMLAIAAFGFAQFILLIYVKWLQKKEGI